MPNVCLYVPKLEDYWYEEYLDGDEATMSYNRGFDVSYSGYHYDSGVIDFPKERWEAKYRQRIEQNRFFAYVLDKDLDKFVGSVNYQFDKESSHYECGVVIDAKYRKKGYGEVALRLFCEEAKKSGIKELYDTFEDDRISAKKLFLDFGFEIVSYITIVKFKKEVKGIIIRKCL